MNTRTSFPRMVKWMFLTGTAFLIFMTVMRLVFYYRFVPLHYSFSGCLKAFLLGLNFDERIACGLVIFPFVIGNLHLVRNSRQRLTVGSIVTVFFTIVVMALLLFFMKKGHAGLVTLTATGAVFALILLWLFVTGNCNPFENAFSRRVFKVYFLVVSLFVVFLYAVDYENYDYLHERLNASLLNYLGNARISLNMVWETYPVFKLTAMVVLGTVALYWLISNWYRKTARSVYTGKPAVRVATGVLFALLLGIGVFGRLNQFPLRWSDAFVFDDNFKSNLALNPVQSFLSTLKFKNSTYDMAKVKAYYPLMAQYLGVDHPDSVHLNYDRVHTASPVTTKPNVVVVICESFSGYKSSMWGNPLNTTPYFAQLCRDGIFFDRCFTPAYGTARGVWAVVTGIPDVEFPNTASRNPAYVNEHSLINDYKGYQKFYFIGGSSSWANIRGLLTNNIDSLHLYEQENYPVKPIDVWGISDKNLFLQANKVLKQQQKPFFAVIQTADNHRPYTIPEEDRKTFPLEHYPTDTLRKYGFESNAELNAFRYTDVSFKTFMEAAQKEPYFRNTIFVFVGDHGIRGDAGSMFPRAWEEDGLTTQHVPLLFYAPALLQPRRIHRTCSQIDLLPSVSALAGIPYTNTTLGKNLFDSTLDNDVTFRNFAFLFDPMVKQIGMVTDQYVYVDDLSTGKTDFRSAADNEPLPDSPQTAATRKALAQLSEAYYQTAKYLLQNNKKR